MWSAKKVIHFQKSGKLCGIHEADSKYCEGEVCWNISVFCGRFQILNYAEKALIPCTDMVSMVSMCLCDGFQTIFLEYSSRLTCQTLTNYWVSRRLGFASYSWNNDMADSVQSLFEVCTFSQAYRPYAKFVMCTFENEGWSFNLSLNLGYVQNKKSRNSPIN